MSGDTQDINKELKRYNTVFFSLLVLTAVTVAISYINLSIKLAVLIALIVATFKASLVSGFFMHLAHEKKTIYYILIVVAFFFISLFGLLILSHYSVFEGLTHVS